MPRQKFCSVPGCLSTTELIKKEQETFLATFCQRCSVVRPCRCPAPDIFTTRKETRSKFTSWCGAIGLKDPGYYINVCYKHFSTGCPSRSCPNPDVVVPVWEKHVRDRMNNNHIRKHNLKACLKRAHNTTNLKAEGSAPPTAKLKSQLADVVKKHELSLAPKAVLMGVHPKSNQNSRAPPGLEAPVKANGTFPVGNPIPQPIKLPSLPISRTTHMARAGSTGSVTSSTASSPDQQEVSYEGKGSLGLISSRTVARSDTHATTNRVLPPNIRQLLASLLHKDSVRLAGQNPPIAASHPLLTATSTVIKREYHVDPHVSSVPRNILSLKPIPLNSLISTSCNGVGPNVLKSQVTPIKIQLPQTPLPMASVRGEPDKFNTPLPNLVTKIATPAVSVHSPSVPPPNLRVVSKHSVEPSGHSPALVIRTSAPSAHPMSHEHHFNHHHLQPMGSHTSGNILFDLGSLECEELDLMEIPLHHDVDVSPQIKIEIGDEENALLDQSEDPCLNEGHNMTSAAMVALISPFSDELDVVNKWLDICEDERNKS